MQTGSFSDSDFTGDLEDWKIHFWRNIMCFWKPYICSKKLDVQETNCCFSQFKRIWNHLFGHWTEIGWFACSGIMGSNCFCPWKHDSDSWKTAETRCQWQRSKIKDLKEWSTCWITLIVFPQTSNFRVKKLCCMYLRTTKQWSKWSLKGGVPQWDTFPGLTELHLIGCLIGLIWDQKSKSNTSTPKNQLADMLTKGNFTRDEWNHLLCLFNISHFSSANCSEVILKRTPKESSAERVTAKSKPMMNLVSRCSERIPDVLTSFASENLVNTKFEKSESTSECAANRYGETRNAG